MDRGKIRGNRGEDGAEGAAGCGRHKSADRATEEAAAMIVDGGWLGGGRVER